MAIRRCPYCKAIIDEAQKYCNNCGTQLLFPDDEPGEEPIKGEKITDEDFPEDESRRFSSDDLDEVKDDVDFDDEVGEEGEEREEIDLEKVIDGEVPLAGNTAEDFGLIDLREAEPEPEDHEKADERVSLEKPDAADEGPPPEIRHPDSSGPEEKEDVRPGRSLARRKKDEVFKPKPPAAGEKPPKLIPHRDGPGPSKMKSDQDTKFQIARLIADFERKRRDYTADLEPPKEPKEKDPAEEPISEPPKTIEPEKEAESPESGPGAGFSMDDDFTAGSKEAETEEPGSLEERLSRLVGGFNSAVESGAESEEEQDGHTRHPEFMTGDLEEPPSAARPEEDPEASPRHPAFVTTDFKSGEVADENGEPSPSSPALSPEESVEELSPFELPAPKAVEPPAPEPPRPAAPASEPVPAPPPGSTDERAALIARILKNRAEKLGRKEETRVSKETSDALAALKTSSAAERAKEEIEREEPEETEKPTTSELEIRPAASVETGEIRKPEEPGESEDLQEPEDIRPQAEESEESREFVTDAWKTPGEDLPPVPTMGFPEELPKTSAPLSLEPAPEELPPPPVVGPSARLPEAAAPEPETAPPAPLTIEEPDDIEEQPAPAAGPARVAAAAAAFTGTMEEEPPSPPVRAPVVHLGFFRRIRATIFDLLVVGAFWSAAALMTAHFLSMPLFELLKTSGFTMLLLYMILLVIYFFFFFLFLGETPGGRLVTPRD